MPRTSNIKAYADIAETLSALRSRGGGLIRFSTRGSAVSWRHRAYKYRLLLKEQDDRAYDYMHLSIENNAVLVRFLDPPRIEDIEGNEVTADDELMQEAKRVAKELGLDDD